MTKNIFKSVGAILLAFIVSALLSVATDFLLEAIGVLSDPSEGLFITWMIIVVLFYRAIYLALAGFLVARLAPSKPMTHAMILGVTGTIITLLALLDPTFDEKAPIWFVITLAGITIPSIWLGVKIELNWKNE